MKASAMIPVCYCLISIIAQVGDVHPQPANGRLAFASDLQQVAISHLGVTLQVPPDQFVSVLPLGVDSSRSIVAWAETAAGQPAVLRFDPSTGSLINSSFASAVTGSSRPGTSRINFHTETQTIYLLDGRQLHLIGLDGRRLRTVQLPFPARSIAGVTPEFVYVAGERAGSASPVHRLRLPAGDLEPHDELLHHFEERNAVRHGVIMSDGDLWTIPGHRYQLEQWVAPTLRNATVLRAHPAALSYLLGPYSEYQVVGAHVTDDKHLWALLRLTVRSPPPGEFESDAHRFDATYDGLVEVIDLESREIVAVQYLPEFEIGGWIAGPIGYRVHPSGAIELVHCALTREE